MLMTYDVHNNSDKSSTPLRPSLGYSNRSIHQRLTDSVIRLVPVESTSLEGISERVQSWGFKLRPEGTITGTVREGRSLRLRVLLGQKDRSAPTTLLVVVLCCTPSQNIHCRTICLWSLLVIRRQR